MAEENQNNENEEKLTDIEIAELANKELKKRDAEIADLTKKLAKAKLLQKAEDEEEKAPAPSKEDCIKVIGDSRTSNYDYAEAVCNLVDCCKADGEANPLGKDGDEIYDFFREVLEDCKGDKTKFTSIYQSKIGNDDSKIAATYLQRTRQK